jgi:PhnB protein
VLGRTTVADLPRHAARSSGEGTDRSGKIHHAEISIGGSRIMLADEHPEIQALSPKTIGGSPVSINLYGDGVGGIEDPFGYRWFIATHKEDLTQKAAFAAAQKH